MRMSYGIYEDGRDMVSRTKKGLLAEMAAAKKQGKHGEIISLDRCSCGCGGAHADKNIISIKF